MHQLALLGLIVNVVITDIGADYMKEREKLTNLDSHYQIGHDVQLSEKEELVDEIILHFKRKELDLALISDKSLQEESFILVKDEIEKSEVFKIIKQMPKGALLHIHDTSMASYEYIINQWTYDEHCYMCFHETNQKILEFKMSNTIPKHNRNDCQWVSVSKSRGNYTGSKEEFDAMILSHLTLTKEDIHTMKDQNTIWKKFQNVFFLLNGLITYYDVFLDYFRFALEQLVEDNIQYVEVRAILPPLYHLDGTVDKHARDTLRSYIAVEEEFKKEHSQDFYGAKFIYSVLRSLSHDVIKRGVQEAIMMYEEFPEHFAGFDLVGQEDKGFTLLHFKEDLLLPRKLKKNLPYFFHAGETDWQGASVDANLYDAFLLNTSRIGHGYAIAKHPYLKKEAKNKNVSIELCPISNQVLGLVKDLRDHPATILLAEDQPITVNSDDPAIWQSSASSHDLYQVLLGMTPAHAGLKVLKKLAMNSIMYSDLDKHGKDELFVMWKSKWEDFLDRIIQKYQPAKLLHPDLCPVMNKPESHSEKP